MIIAFASAATALGLQHRRRDCFSNQAVMTFSYFNGCLMFSFRLCTARGAMTQLVSFPIYGIDFAQLHSTVKARKTVEWRAHVVVFAVPLVIVQEDTNDLTHVAPPKRYMKAHVATQACKSRGKKIAPFYPVKYDTISAKRIEVGTRPKKNSNLTAYYDMIR